MKCYIRRIQNDKECFFAKHLWENKNHWVIFREEAKEFGSVKEAKWFINFYKIKNCEVVK